MNVRLTVSVGVSAVERWWVRDMSAGKVTGAVKTRPNTRFKSRYMLHAPSPTQRLHV